MCPKRKRDKKTTCYTEKYLYDFNHFDQFDWLEEMKLMLLFEHLRLPVVVDNVIDLSVLLLLKLNTTKP